MVNHSLVSHFQKKWNPDPTQPKLFWGGTMFPPQCASYLSRPFLTFTVVVADSLSQDLMHKWPRLRVREDCQPDLWASWLLQHRVDHVSQVSQQAGLVTLADCCHLNLFFFLLWPKKSKTYIALLHNSSFRLGNLHIILEQQIWNNFCKRVQDLAR